jgi:putative membrane-bound dehydrogenase-like protein
MRLLVSLVLACALTGMVGAAVPSMPAGVANSQKPGDVPMPPAEALLRMTLPSGFKATLSAGEPDVMQPIAFDFDDRGRLWVVEAFSYPDNKVEDRDRVLIFTDRDGDGKFDERKVFLDNGRRLSGITLGFGGVWLTGPPHLLFIPDRDGDDVPDEKPEIILDGWTRSAGHNMVNGLAWGPDGWLYGRHGITTHSLVGRPGTPEKERTKLSCSIWRYHPVKRVFEVVAHGTTNPWGLDWDDEGQPFFSNNVIGHLWHLIPGAHYKRMFGEDFNPHVYQLMDQCADHLHWAGKDWTKARSGQGALGGGHSHCGAMIYLGDNWPQEFRRRILSVNIHGNRVLYDQLVRSGSGYTARHGDNLLMANDPWFRGVTIACGPDGGVYVSDWNDLGECHDHDGSYRASGRIYKITFGNLTGPRDMNLAKLSDVDLVNLQLHPNDWFVRHARRLLQERFVAGKLESTTITALHSILRTNTNTTRRLRALWALHVTGGTQPTISLPSTRPGRMLQRPPFRTPVPQRSSILSTLLLDPDEHLRWWAIQLLAENRDVPAADVQQFAQMARDEKSPLVRLALASVMQRLPLESRWNIAFALARHGEDAADQNLPLMLWYAVEPLVPTDRPRSIELLKQAQIPLLREFIARRMVD